MKFLSYNLLKPNSYSVSAFAIHAPQQQRLLIKFVIKIVPTSILDMDVVS